MEFQLVLHFVLCVKCVFFYVCEFEFVKEVIDKGYQSKGNDWLKEKSKENHIE